MIKGRGFLTPGAPVFVARAPGRLDVMGGIADYSGSLVLQLPLDRHTVAMLQPTEEPNIEAWYIARFLGFWREAQGDPRSFYARFLSLDETGVTQVAKAVWSGVNLPNLRNHILAVRAIADVVVHKAADHNIDLVEVKR